jgi:hypothetical protein
MFATQSVELPRPTYSALWEYLKQQGRQWEIPSVLADAVELWMAKQQEAKGTYGYQWKTVFLPEGTVLRSWSYGEHNYAKVQGDRIIYEGRVVSPNQLAQHFGRSTRNAWNDLFIRRPGDKTFKQACLLRIELEREEQELRQTRLADAGPVITTPAAPSVVSSTPLLSSSTGTSGTPSNTLPAIPDSDLSPQALATIVTSVLAHMTPPRDTTPGPGWSLPERRKHRYRLEDVAFE